MEFIQKKKMTIVALTLGVILLGSGAYFFMRDSSSTNPKDRLCNYADLGELANTLAVLADGEKIEGCTISAEDSLDYMMKLKAQTDECMAEGKNVGEWTQETWHKLPLKDCEKKCTCGFFLYLHDLSFGGANPETKTQWDEVQAKGTVQTATDRLQCAKNSPALCSEIQTRFGANSSDH